MFRAVIAVLRDQKALANLEYALIAGLIFSALLNAEKAFAPKLSAAFANLGQTLVARDKGT